jgi:nucleotide-binding universal stress UspA family protein
MEIDLSINIISLAPRTESQIRYGDPRQEVLRYAREQEIDAIFLGPHSGSKADRPSFGSLASAGVREAETTVEIVRKV